MLKLGGGELSEQMSVCRVNTSNQRRHPHLLKDQGASDDHDALKKGQKISKAAVFFLNTCKTKFRTCDLTVEAAAGGRKNIATVATTTRGCGNTLAFFFVSGRILQGVAQV